MIIGLISDTHGLLRKEVIENLSDCELIIHAGDIGKYEVIDNLEQINNVEFIIGNCDKNLGINLDKEEKIINIMDTNIYLIHDINNISIDLMRKNIDIVIFGHSHKSKVYVENDIIYINPGSVGPRRFKLPVTMAKLKIDDKYISGDLEINGNIFKYKNYEVEVITISI